MDTATIVIISDDSIFTALTVAMLRSRGYSTQSFATSTAGIAECYRHPPDLVLIKYAAFDVPPDAYTVCASLRRTHQTLPLILITPHRDEALRSGASAWFDVVFDIGEVLAQADMLIRHFPH
jgi:DNA-binding response OmpR family regulator